jgi:hypothetical protein
MLSKQFFLRITGLLLMSFVVNLAGFGQNDDNNITISSVPLNFNLASTFSLENEQVINNALTIRVESKKNYNVFVRISNMTNTSGTPIPPNMLSMQLSGSDESSQSFPVTTRIYLSQTDQLIIADRNRAANKTGDSFFYDYYFGPLGYDYAPGIYTFTLLFTMTQP